MTTKPPAEIRAVLLSVIEAQHPKDRSDGSLQTGSVIRESARQLGAMHNLELEQGLLTQLHDLFRTGYLAWGLNISNPNPPFFHVTTAGRRLLSRLSRDPGNPAGYRAHLAAVANVGPVADSYLVEGIECYVAGLYKAAAVMTGGAAESLALQVRDALVSRLNSLNLGAPKDLSDWRIKRALDAIHSVLSQRKASMPVALREEFEAYWPAFGQQIRASRNDAGHPSSVDPVSAETVQASLLIFPELAKLQNELLEWIANDLA